MRTLFFVCITTLCLGCTNITTLGDPPRLGPLSLVVDPLWSTTTRFDDRSETPDEVAMREAREAERVAREREENECLTWYADRVLAEKDDALLTAHDRRCAVVVGVY